MSNPMVTGGGAAAKQPIAISAATRPAGRSIDVRPVCWAAVLVAGLSVLLISGWYGSISGQPARLATYAILIGWLGVAAIRPAWLPRTPLLLPVLGASAIFVLTAVLSQRPQLSWNSILMGLAVAAVFLFVSRLASDAWFRARLRVVLTAFPVIVALAYVGQVIFVWLEFWNIVGSIVLLPPLRPGWVDLTFGSPNLVATVLLLTGPLSVAFIAAHHRRVAVMEGALFGVAILLTGSRSSLVGIAIVAVVAGIVVATQRRGQLRLLRRRWLATGIVLLLLALLIVPALVYRFSQGGEVLRLDLWLSALTIFVQNPLFGGGPGTWVQLKLFATPAGAANLVIPHAHDIYLQTLAEIGLVGTGALLTLLALIGRRLLRAARGVDKALSRESIAVMLGLAAVGGQWFTDDSVFLPGICLLLVLVVAWVDGGLVLGEATDVSNRPPVRPLARIAGGVALALIVLSMVPTAVLDRAAAAADLGNAAAAHGDWIGALADYDQARSVDPGLSLYQLEHAIALARLGRVTEARAELGSALQADGLPLNLVSLAALDASDGDCQSAMEHASVAVDRSPNDPGVELNAGAVAERCASVDQAVAWYGAGLAAAPQLAADPYWRSGARASNRAAILAAATASLVASGDTAGAITLSAAAGDLQAARDRLAALQSPCPTCSAVIDWESGNRSRAISELTVEITANPFDWMSTAALARYFWLEGDDADATLYARWADIVQADAAPILETLPSRLSVDAPDSQLEPPGYPGAIYLEAGPIQFWVPGLLTPVFAR